MPIKYLILATFAEIKHIKQNVALLAHCISTATLITLLPSTTTDALLSLSTVSCWQGVGFLCCTRFFLAGDWEVPSLTFCLHSTLGHLPGKASKHQHQYKAGMYRQLG